jgi:alkyl hydroperoxide reductase subunit AhpF
MTAMLDNELRQQIREVFAVLRDRVEILFFGSKKENCQYCEDTYHLLEEITPLSEKLNLHQIDVDEEPDKAKKFHIDKIPGIVIAGIKNDTLVDFGVRFAGIPAGHEFTTLIRDILMVSSGESGLKLQTKEYLASLKSPLIIQVFITPT